MKYKTENLNDFKKVVEDFFDFLNSNKTDKNVILLSGNLGAGKTTFVQALGKLFKIKSKINSPTFVLMKRYLINSGRPTSGKLYRNLYHMDAYRLEGKDIKKELEILKLSEIIENKENLILIEWGELIEKYLPKKIIKINIKDKGENSREVDIKF